MIQFVLTFITILLIPFREYRLQNVRVMVRNSVIECTRKLRVTKPSQNSMKQMFRFNCDEIVDNKFIKTLIFSH